MNSSHFAAHDHCPDSLTHLFSMKQHPGLPLFSLLLGLPGALTLRVDVCVCVALGQPCHQGQRQELLVFGPSLWARGSHLFLLSLAFLTCPVAPKLQRQLYRCVEEACLTRFHCRKSSPVTNLSIHPSAYPSAGLSVCISIRSPRGSASLNAD